MSRRYLFLAVCVTLEGCLNGIGRLRDILVRVSMEFQSFLSHIIYTFTYVCVCIILYTCIISVYMIETRDLSCSSESHTKMQAVTQSIMFTNSSVSTISYKKQNTDRCLSCSGEEVQVKVSE